MAPLATAELRRAHEHYEQRAWMQAFEALATADGTSALCPDDLERLATAAYLIGRDDDYLATLDRAHNAYLHAGEKLRGARCAFWLGLRLFMRGEKGRATGWLARAERLARDGECVERGYLLLVPAEQSLRAGDPDAGYATATTAVAIAEQFGDADLLACALHLQGRALLNQGQTARGLALLDETMLAVATGHLSPIVTGLMYCSVIDACQQVFAAGRAREWTVALSRWCEEQREMVAFTGVCLAHRAQILRLHGAWSEALKEAHRAAERGTLARNRSAAAVAWYEAGELHRLRGEFAAAEEAYRSASGSGREPQPGLALLRLAQGRTSVAMAAIRRVAAAANDTFEQISVLPAYVEIMLAAGDFAAAHAAGDTLDSIAARLDSQVISATAAHVRGTIEIEAQDPYAALGLLRKALTAWQAIDAPYLAARTRVAIARACYQLGDEDGAALELDAASSVLERLGAEPDLAQVAAARQRTRASRSSSHGLTRRELEVLEVLATGQTNRQIAAQLGLAEKTVDRHVSNILAKLCVPSRAGATAYAYRHRLL